MGPAAALGITTETVAKMIATGFQAFSTKLVSVFSDIGTDVTDRMDAIAETIGYDCNLQQSPDVDGLTMAVHEADLLDSLRASNRSKYDFLLANAEKVWAQHPTGRRRLVKALAEQASGTG